MEDLLWIVVPCMYYIVSHYVYQFGNSELFHTKRSAIVFSLLWPLWIIVVLLVCGMMALVAITVLFIIIVCNLTISNKPENIKVGNPF